MLAHDFYDKHQCYKLSALIIDRGKNVCCLRIVNPARESNRHENVNSLSRDSADLRPEKRNRKLREHENHDIAIAMSSSCADPVLAGCI